MLAAKQEPALRLPRENQYVERTANGGKVPGPGKIPATYFPLRGSDGTEMRSQREGAGIMGIPEASAEGTEPCRTGTAGLPEQGQLPAGLHTRPDSGRVSRSGLVSLVHARGAGEDYSGTLDQGPDCGRVRFRAEFEYEVMETSNFF